MAATLESMSLYIDLEKRKVTEFEQEKLDIMDKFINENKEKFNSENLVLSGKLKNRYGSKIIIRRIRCRGFWN